MRLIIYIYDFYLNKLFKLFILIKEIKRNYCDNQNSYQTYTEYV